MKRLFILVNHHSQAEPLIRMVRQAGRENNISCCVVTAESDVNMMRGCRDAAYFALVEIPLLTQRLIDSTRLMKLTTRTLDDWIRGDGDIPEKTATPEQPAEIQRLFTEAPASVVLDEAARHGLKQVVVLGWDKSDVMYTNINFSDAAEALYLMARAERRIMDEVIRLESERDEKR